MLGYSPFARPSLTRTTRYCLDLAFHSWISLGRSLSALCGSPAMVFCCACILWWTVSFCRRKDPIHLPMPILTAFESLEKSQPLLRAWAIPGRLYNTILLALPIGLLLLTSFLTALLTANVSRGLYNIAKSIDLLQGILAGTSPLDTYGSAVAITQNALSHVRAPLSNFIFRCRRLSDCTALDPSSQ